MEKLLYVLVAACVLLMNTQHGLTLRVGGHAVNLGIVDVVIWITFGLWAIQAAAGKTISRIKLPPVAFLALPILAVISILRLGGFSLGVAGKEIFQLVEYFIVAALLFINFGATEAKLRGLISVFLLGITAVVLWGVIDYVASPDNAFAAGGAFGNINVLGVYFGLALPFALGIALFDDLKLWQRVSLVVPVAAGSAITLSGAALAATLAALLLVLALRSAKLLAAGLAVVVAGIIVLPGILRPHHAQIVTSSVAVYLDNNYLLSSAALLKRARALAEGGRYVDARRVLLLVDTENELTPDGAKLLEQVEEKIKGEDPQMIPLPADRPVVAVRYKRRQAALKAITGNIWGYGPGSFQETIGQFYGKIPTFAYGTDEVEAFNMGIDEPDTFNRFLVTTVELGVPGLLALLWFYLWSFSRSVGLFAVAKTDLSRGVAAGATASLAFFPILAAYSDVIVRGAALPLVFIICCVYVLSKEETK